MKSAGMPQETAGRVIKWNKFNLLSRESKCIKLKRDLKKLYKITKE